MTDIEKIELYDNCLFLNTIDRSSDPYYCELCKLIMHSNEGHLRLFNRNEITDKMKIEVVDSLSNILDRIKEIEDINLFKHISFFVLNSQLNHYLLVDFLKLLYFPDECLADKGLEDRYLSIIEHLLDFEDYYTYDLLKHIPLFNYVVTYFDYMHDNNVPYNIFISNIILYCLKEKYDKDSFMKILDKAYEYYDYLKGYYELNDDDSHVSELDNNIVSKIINGSFNEKVIR